MIYKVALAVFFVCAILCTPYNSEAQKIFNKSEVEKILNPESGRLAVLLIYFKGGGFMHDGLEAKIKDIALEYPELDCYLVDTTNESTSKLYYENEESFGVRSVPTVLLYKNGQLVKKLLGTDAVLELDTAIKDNI